MDFIKDVLAIFFIVRLDDFDDARGWTSDAVLQDALDSDLLAPDSSDAGAVETWEREKETMPSHIFEKRARDMLFEIESTFLYTRPTPATWFPIVIDWVTWPLDRCYSSDERHYK